MQTRSIASSSLALTLAAAMTLTPMRGAFAAGDDATVTVWTKDGAMYRGEVVERVPDDHVTLKLATGETKRIEWKDVDHDSIGTPSLPATTTTAAAAPTTTTPEPTAQPVQDGVRIHLNGDSTLRLLRETGVGAFVGSAGGHSVAGTIRQFDIVCYAPCDVVVPRSGGYRVGGEGRRYSGAFALGGERQTIDAHLGSSAGYTAGLYSLGFGLGFVGGGLISFWLSSKATSFDANGNEVPDHSLDKYAWTFIGIGAVLTVIGIVAMSSNANEVKVDGETVATKKRSSGFALTPTGFVF